MGDKRFLFIIAGAVLAIIIAAVLLLNTNSGGGKDDIARISARYSSLSKFISSNQNSIKNSNLRTINSNANLLIASDDSTFRAILTGTYGEKAPSKTIVAAEADTSEPQLKEASLIDRFDTKYLSILEEKLTNTQLLLKKISRENKKADVQAATETASKNIEDIYKQLETLSL